MKKSLVLTGMMGVGKTTVGKAVAKKLGFDFIDIDSIIEEKERSSINKIFLNKGEKYFRVIERKTTLNFLGKNDVVISLGGGAFIDNLIRKKVLKHSISFWLDLNTSKIFQRNKKLNKRPLLKNDKTGETLSKIYHTRKKYYNLANFRVNCDNLTKSDTVAEILKIYENSKN